MTRDIELTVPQKISDDAFREAVRRAESEQLSTLIGKGQFDEVESSDGEVSQ